ncbi:uncharacterized protein [Primulina huaijiensis]|uniref:uncharacterized protein isoform X3 n=1 Tax=Primulina huaijiensis TaxID=1492673 RepID=UPI003CC7765B
MLIPLSSQWKSGSCRILCTGEDMTSIALRNPGSWLLGIWGHKGGCTACSNRIQCFVGYSNHDSQLLRASSLLANRRRVRDSPALSAGKLENTSEDDDETRDSDEEENDDVPIFQVNSDMIRDNLERIVGTDDSNFSGIDLATLIRNKYGRSYDVQLIKKEFMGRNLLALNVMWKYMEQVCINYATCKSSNRSLTELFEPKIFRKTLCTTPGFYPCSALPEPLLNRIISIQN